MVECGRLTNNKSKKPIFSFKLINFRASSHVILRLIFSLLLSIRFFCKIVVTSGFKSLAKIESTSPFF